MTLLAGAAAFFVGTAYSSQMPGFANDLGHGDPGVAYSMLLAADAAGGFLAGIVLEGGGWLQPKPRTAIVLAMLWGAALAVFSLSSSYALALGFLFAAGFLELSFNAMAQSLVQLDAPPDKRGRVIGLFNMSSLGLRAFSGVSVGLLGSLIGVHWSLALSALVTLAIAEFLAGAAIVRLLQVITSRSGIVLIFARHVGPVWIDPEPATANGLRPGVADEPGHVEYGADELCSVHPLAGGLRDMARLGVECAGHRAAAEGRCNEHQPNDCQRSQM